MRSSQERTKYNQFIRGTHSRNISGPRPHRLEEFEEWRTRDSQKTSLVTFRKVLSDLTLSSERGINRLLKRQGATKLVLLNHQRKPVNYYLRAGRRPGRGAGGTGIPQLS